MQGGLYKLLIDGQLIAKVSATDLQKGINLATTTNTPQYQQALKIMIMN
jgi:hypothetical protein